MSDDGSTKDDVKVPDGDAGDKITKLFTDEGKDTSKYFVISFDYGQATNFLTRCHRTRCYGRRSCDRRQGGSKGLENSRRML